MNLFACDKCKNIVDSVCDIQVKQIFSDKKRSQMILRELQVCENCFSFVATEKYFIELMEGGG